MRPQRVAIIGSSSGRVIAIEAVQRHIDHAAPLLFRHARQRHVVVGAGAVHQDLRHAVRQTRDASAASVPASR